MVDIITKGMLLGLSTGVFCLAYCIPVIFPLICAEKRPWLSERAWLVLKFFLGRLIAYLAFGGMVGYMGQRFSSPLLHKFAAGSIVILSILLILYGILKGFPQLRICPTINRFLPKKRLPLLMGLFTGFNVCPPFLLALTYVFNLGQITKGVVFFFAFFIATSLYLVPFVFIGYFSKFEKVRWVAQMCAILSGMLFFFIGVSQYLRG